MKAWNGKKCNLVSKMETLKNSKLYSSSLKMQLSCTIGGEDLTSETKYIFTMGLAVLLGQKLHSEFCKSTDSVT